MTHCFSWTVGFKYDALGRMLRREKSGAGGGDNVTFDYWMGLNKIAQESGGAGAEICVPDNETCATPAAENLTNCRRDKTNWSYIKNNGANVPEIHCEEGCERAGYGYEKNK